MTRDPLPTPRMVVWQCLLLAACVLAAGWAAGMMIGRTMFGG